MIKDTKYTENIIKMNDAMERKYTKYKGVDCVYHKENNNMIWNYYRAYK